LRVHSTNSFYYSGSTGAFGIPSAVIQDTITFSLNGYDERKLVINAKDYQTIILKPSININVSQKKKLLSITIDKEPSGLKWWAASGETYSQQVENMFNDTKRFATTGFALNIDKASYSNIRRFINLGGEVPYDAVRIEEMLNYFPVPYKVPGGDSTFSFEQQVTDCPWQQQNKLMFLRMHAKKSNYDHLPPGNFVFLIDISGSMDLPNRLPLLKSAFRMLVQNLRPVDTISIVAYGGTVGIMLQPTSGSEQQKIMNVIDSLQAGGETPGESAIRTAYTLAQKKFIKGGNNRVILATDGDFNVGEVSEEALMELIVQKQQTGIYLTCLGVGMGNYKDSKLEILAKKGNGNFAYLDHVMEAEKVLVTELMQTLYSAANETFLKVTFHENAVKRYRLIGYDNRKDMIADSTSSVEGGEIGSGHTVTAVFEIEPADTIQNIQSPLASVILSFQKPGSAKKVEQTFSYINNYKTLHAVDSNYRFSTAVVLFGLLLKRSPYVAGINWDLLQSLLATCVNTNDYWQNEMKLLAGKAKSIYVPVKKKKAARKKKTR
jgi:Ca-activated chloride channel family protein